jgi:hypothetical protein
MQLQVVYKSTASQTEVKECTALLILTLAAEAAHTPTSS